MWGALAAIDSIVGSGVGKRFVCLFRGDEIAGCAVLDSLCMMRTKDDGRGRPKGVTGPFRSHFLPFFGRPDLREGRPEKPHFLRFLREGRAACQLPSQRTLVGPPLCRWPSLGNVCRTDRAGQSSRVNWAFESRSVSLPVHALVLRMNLRSGEGLTKATTTGKPDEDGLTIEVELI